MGAPSLLIMKRPSAENPTDNSTGDQGSSVQLPKVAWPGERGELDVGPKTRTTVGMQFGFRVSSVTAAD